MEWLDRQPDREPCVQITKLRELAEQWKGQKEMTENKIDNGGPAFPHTIPITTESDPKIVIGRQIQQGMSLRDYFAGQALVGLLHNCTTTQEDVHTAYDYADAMIKARKENKDGNSKEV